MIGLLFIVLLCTLTGSLVGAALPGLAVGVVLAGLLVWVNSGP